MSKDEFIVWLLGLLADVLTGGMPSPADFDKIDKFTEENGIGEDWLPQ